MKIEMLMPQMGESIAEATIAKWKKKVGDTVRKDEAILEISTDKVDSEIPAPAAGVIADLKYKEGDVVPVKTVIAIIETDAAQASVSSQSAPAASPPPPQQQVPQHSAPASTSMQRAVEPQQPATQQPTQSAGSTNGDGGSVRFISPLVRNLAAKHGIPLNELSQIEGSGQGGRVSKQDLLDYVANRGSGAPRQQPTQAAAPAAQPQYSPPPSTRAPVPAEIPGQEWREDETKVVPMDGMRRAIAEHMVRSKHTSPHVYSVQEVDVTNISKWRKKYKAEFESKEGFGLSFTPFFLEAAVKGLQKFPYVNCSVEGNAIILKKHINLGCAVAIGNSGLIVPVIKRAEERNLVGIARALTDLANRARNKKLLPDDVAGGTFTVTNPGVFGTLIGTPIINQPQVAILCLGAIEKRPVVIDDMIAIRERCYLTLSYDHRVVDGSLGGQYLAFVRDYLENWDLERPLY